MDITAPRTLVAALMLVLPTSVASPALATDEPPDEMTVSGTFIRTETFQPDRADLCVAECLREEGADYSMALSEVAEDGSFRFDRVSLARNVRTGGHIPLE